MDLGLVVMLVICLILFVSWLLWYLVSKSGEILFVVGLFKLEVICLSDLKMCLLFLMLCLCNWY